MKVAIVLGNRKSSTTAVSTPVYEANQKRMTHKREMVCPLQLVVRPLETSECRMSCALYSFKHTEKFNQLPQSSTVKNETFAQLRVR
jgi:hypothetical protein